MKKILAIIAILAVAFAGAVAPVPALAQTCGGVEIADDAHCDIDPIRGGNDALLATVKNVLSAIFGVMGIIAAVVIIIGGVLYTISAGDPGKVATAKKAITYAIIGLVVSLSAFAITNFIIGAL